MNDALRRRGPDDAGAYESDGVGLAMRRLSIIDVAGGRQPIANEDKTIHVVFNGEIYNYRELRTALIERGHRFETQSDTEVIVHLYEERGDGCVDALRGMFAFALWDGRQRRGLIARDRLGIKPLFYAEHEGTLLFGSEMKAVLASGIVATELDLQALDAYLAYGYVPAPMTIYRGVRKLEAGHVLAWERGRVTRRCYWDVDFSRVDVRADAEAWRATFESALDDAVESHLVSDVPVGAFLSGGVDSSVVVAMMARHTAEPIRTFTIGFGGSAGTLIDERPIAAAVAQRYGCRYAEHTVEPDFRAIAGDIVQAFDEPFADDSVIPSYYLAQATAREVKVALSGLGGDELFAGYERYSGVLLSRFYADLAPRSLHRNLIQPVMETLPESLLPGNRIDHAKRFSAAALHTPARRYLGFVSALTAAERSRLFTPELARLVDFDATDRIVLDLYEGCDAPDDIARALYVDLHTYLPDDILALSDRLGMWHSLEVRVPLVDHRLVELAAALPTRYKIDWRRKKILLRRIAADLVPDEVLAHRKQGFESPMASWLRNDLASHARELLGPSRLGGRNLFDPRFVEQSLAAHASGRRSESKLLFRLMMLEHWFEASRENPATPRGEG